MILDIVDGATEKNDHALRRIVKALTRLHAFVATPLIVVKAADWRRPDPDYGQRPTGGGQTCVLGSQV
ncbi:MAG: hypothetical protein ABIR27_07420 [Dokdonella sp.]